MKRRPTLPTCIPIPIRIGIPLCPRSVVTGLLFLFAIAIPRAELPGEVTELHWCPASKDCLTWPPVPNGTTYDLHRGDITGLPGLLDGGVDSCLAGSYEDTTTGPGAAPDPLAGSLHWYLVTARNIDGSGGAGEGSSGPRVLNGSGSCATVAGLVINEIDYDQPGTDYGEFVEIYNGLSTPRDLSGLALILVNGGTSEEYRRYLLADAGSSLAPGGYLVVGSPTVLASLPPGTMSIPSGSTSNALQNGAPDGVALFDTGSAQLLDALSYEGSITDARFEGVGGVYNLVEGTPLTDQDSNASDGSLSRGPDGRDTDDADNDWSFVTVPSPGSPNPAP